MKTSKSSTRTKGKWNLKCFKQTPTVGKRRLECNRVGRGSLRQSSRRVGRKGQPLRQEDPPSHQTVESLGTLQDFPSESHVLDS